MELSEASRSLPRRCSAASRRSSGRGARRSASAVRYISATSRLHLGCISAVPRLSLAPQVCLGTCSCAQKLNTHSWFQRALERTISPTAHSAVLRRVHCILNTRMPALIARRLGQLSHLCYRPTHGTEPTHWIRYSAGMGHTGFDTHEVWGTLDSSPWRYGAHWIRDSGGMGHTGFDTLEVWDTLDSILWRYGAHWIRYSGGMGHTGFDTQQVWGTLDSILRRYGAHWIRDSGGMGHTGFDTLEVWGTLDSRLWRYGIRRLVHLGRASRGAGRRRAVRQPGPAEIDRDCTRLHEVDDEPCGSQVLPPTPSDSG